MNAVCIQYRNSVFKQYYEWGEKLRVEGLAESELGPKLMPFTLTHTTDLKAAWFLSNRGGGCKNKTHFCHLCACTKDTLTSFSIGDLHSDTLRYTPLLGAFLTWATAILFVASAASLTTTLVKRTVQ
jgi:hypothetical protein